MSWEAWVTLLVLLAAITVMVLDIATPAIAILSSTVLLFSAGVITSEEALAGFANPAPWTIAALYVLAAAASRTGALRPLIQFCLSPKGSDRTNLSRLLPPVSLFSSVLNNTPIVAVLVPEIQSWARQNSRKVPRLLMPISFAAILGGTLTVIGTSTNLVVSGLLETSGAQPIGFFELLPLGIPIVLGGLIILIFLAPKLLDKVTADMDRPRSLAREWLIEILVEESEDSSGVVLRDSKFNNLSGIRILHVDTSKGRVSDDFDYVLRAGDTIRLVGNIHDITDVFSRSQASVQNLHQSGIDHNEITYFEAAIGPSSRLVGLNIRQAGFHSRYSANMVALHRPRKHPIEHFEDVVLESGDKLVIAAPRSFQDTWRDHRDFLLVSPLTAIPPPRTNQYIRVLAILASVIVAAGAGWLSILRAALIGAVAVVALRIVNMRQIMKTIDLNVILLISSGFGLGAAMKSSGLAEKIADITIDSLGVAGGIGALASVVIVTILLTEAVSNTAAALIVFPIAVTTANNLGIDPRSFAIAIALAASASFLTPVGYQTNAMVQNPGGYRFRDYTIVGFPLTILLIAVILIGVPIVWPFS